VFTELLFEVVREVDCCIGIVFIVVVEVLITDDGVNAANIAEIFCEETF
jgi:hypothetical protein